MLFILLAFGIGIVAGLRSLTAPAATSWAVRIGGLSLGDSWLAFLGYAWTPWIFTVAALGELVADKLPGTPSRKKPPSFIFRIVSGAFCGAAIGIHGGNQIAGILAGAVGAVAGTLGGASFRSGLVKATGGKDLPIALLEDAIAIVLAIVIVRAAA